MNKVYCIIILNFLSICCHAQEFNLNGIVLDNDSAAVEFASIFNKRSKQFTYSDDNGKFRLSCEIGDTLSISHVTYESKHVAVTSPKQSIHLKPLTISLDEVVIISSKNQSNYYTLKKKLKKVSQYGLTIDSKYLFEIKNFTKNQLELLSIVIPIEFRKNFSNEGSIIIQVKKILASDNKIDYLSGDYKSYKVADLSNDKELVIPTNNETLNPDESIYVLIQRVLTNQTFDNSSRTLSLNPFLYISTEEQSIKETSMVKMIGSQKWINLSDWFSTTPSFDLRLNTRITENNNY